MLWQKLLGKLLQQSITLMHLIWALTTAKRPAETIHHMHLHLIPRYEGDVPNPRGGIRHVIPGKADY